MTESTSNTKDERRYKYYVKKLKYLKRRRKKKWYEKWQEDISRIFGKEDKKWNGQ